MKAIELTQQWFGQWFAYLSACFELPMTAPICRPAWTLAAIGSAAIAGVLTLWLLWRLIDYKLKLRAALRAQAERDRIDHEAIAHTQWIGDTAYHAELSEEEVRRRIAEGLEAHKTNAAPISGTS
ncbi:MAG: hypothetical protein OEP48_14190 [Betaproteobacteria bacterium]|nr:hypothetical protein [Betaproteobacteria bacterium]